MSAFENNVRYFLKGSRAELTCFCEYYPLEPIIIAPTAFQNLGNPHLESIWLAAHQALEEADEWIIAGYSLPSEDLALRGLLYRALESRRRSGRTTQVTVVNPEVRKSDFTKRYESFFDQPIQKRSIKFGQYVQKYMHA